MVAAVDCAPRFALVAWSLLVTTMTDLAHMIIPDEISKPCSCWRRFYLFASWAPWPMPNI